MAKKETKMKCLKCGSEKMIQRDFYRSASELHNGSYNRIPICKNCMLEHYDKLLSTYEGNSNSAFRHWCITFDTYYDETLYLQCIEKDNFIGEYMRLTGSTKDRKDKTSLNNKLPDGNVKNIQLEDGVVTESLIVEWGRYRDKNDYLMLQKRYKELVKQFPSKTPEEQYIIKDICKLELDIEECRQSGKVDKIASLENIKSKKMHDLDAIPSERKFSAKDEDIKIFGCGVRVYETSRPIPNVSEKFKDVDNLTEYWERTIVKPMAKMQGLADGEYSLEKGMEDIEFTPEYMEVVRELNGE